ncbi:hypothetical protein [Desulfosediminicola flagellatus]|uniref:hypothetical protein n=1 Tax=Desulfosediminicola flagellatus TaxID=2569541 RepID=UPI0010ACA7BD|nr:hypothetical protein [Desulfosediminicola flagellatus]
MKLSKYVVGLVGIVASVLLWGGMVSAATSCTSATIESIVIVPELESEAVSKYVITPDCDNASWDSIEESKLREFVLTKDIGAAGYALALTAMSTGKKVSFTVQSTNWRSLVTRVRILN